MRFSMLALYLGCAVPSVAADEVTASREGKQVVIRAGGREILRYQAEGELPRPGIPDKFLRGGYIASILTPSGQRITDDYAENHLHHHGVWSSWTKTSFQDRTPDFWNMGEETGKVDFTALDKIWQKDGKAGFIARNEYVDLGVQPSRTVLSETLDVTVSVDAKAYIIDWTCRQSSATDSPLKLLEYHYGGFAFRGNFDWNSAAQCEFLSSSGKTDRIKINTSRENWCWMGGKTGGEIRGVALMGHPSNFRSPQPLRAHPSEPFLCFAPTQLGEFQIAAGKEYSARYRLIVTDGKPDATTLEKWWETYSKTP